VNGFGRIGRLDVRAARRRDMKDVTFVAVNDLTDAKTLAHLFPSTPSTVSGASRWRPGIGHRRHQDQVLKEKDPGKLPWKELASMSPECTLFTDRDSASVHLKQVRASCASRPGWAPTPRSSSA
jgi:glyceraldehyde 3-phosphate dehydrogenase